VLGGSHDPLSGPLRRQLRPPVPLKHTEYSGGGRPCIWHRIDPDHRHPVDAALGLGSTRYALEVDRQVALGASRMSFDATLKMMAVHNAAHVPKRQAEQPVKRSAVDFDAFYGSTRLHLPEPTGELQALTFDQRGDVLRYEDLTETTRKAAQKASPKMDSRRSKGEVKRGRKRRASVAAVYTVAPHERTADEMFARLRRVHDASTKPKPRPRPEGKRVSASLRRPLKDVISDAFDEATDRDPDHRKRWLVLVDGDDKLIELVRAEAKEPPQNKVTNSTPNHPAQLPCAAFKYMQYSRGVAPCRTGASKPSWQPYFAAAP